MRHMIFIGCVVGIVAILTIRSLCMFRRLRGRGTDRQTSVLLTGIDIFGVCLKVAVSVTVLILVGKYVF